MQYVITFLKCTRISVSRVTVLTSHCLFCDLISMYFFVTLSLARSHNPIGPKVTTSPRIRMYRYYTIFIRTGFNLREVSHS